MNRSSRERRERPEGADQTGHERFACFLVGEGLIASRAFEALLASGHRVLGVHTADRAFGERVNSAGSRLCADRAAFCEALESEPFDFLFSVNNGWIIPDALLGKARVSAINYHDAPLPRYGGLYATSWALLNQEEEHGITWHEMVAGIDEGQIIVQRRFAIARSDTAHTLNARSYEVAISAFTELVRGLSRNVPKSPQPSEVRTYYGLADRPRHAGFLDFNQPAGSLDALVRGLDFGPVRNRFAAAKCFLGGEPVVVTRLVDTGDTSDHPPGHVAALEARGVVVATSTTNVRIDGVVSLSGEPRDVVAVCAARGVSVGLHVERGTAERTSGKGRAQEREAWGERFARSARYEPYWTSRLGSPLPVAPPFGGARLDQPKAHALPLFGQAMAELPMSQRRGAALCFFAALAARISEGTVFDLGLSVSGLAPGDGEVFAELVPLRLRAPEETSFAAFETHFSEALSEARKRETYVRDLVAREPALRARPIARLGLGVRVEPDETARPEPFDASLLLVLLGGAGVPALWSHDALSAHAVQSMDRQLAELSRAAMRDPSIRLSELPLVSSEEAFLQLETWNQTRRAYPSETPLHMLIAEQAERTPTAPAVRFGSARLTYSELEEKSRRVAARLQRLGVGPGHSVAVCVGRSTDLVVALLGVLKSGAAYVPIDPGYPGARVAAIVAEAKPSALVAGDDEARVFEPSLSRVRLDASGDGEEEARSFEPAPVSAVDIAYVIFTSGSTGKPKGVEIPHRGIVNHSIAIRDLYALCPGQRMLCSASIGFDVCGEQIYPALLGGAEVVVRPEDLFESFSRFEAFMRHEEITTAVLPTAFWHEWVRSLEAGQRRVPESFRVLSVGTEKALPEFLSIWQRLGEGRVRFFQGYGPTEASVTCTMYVHHEETEPLWEDVLPIGRPLPNVRVYVLDARLRPVPIGMSGELYVGGDGLARGYRGRPDLTTERFIPSPFHPGERLYRTGDVVRFLPDGNLVYVGRSDFQVKLRGYRIELGEIEATLRKAPGVGDAVVLLREDVGREPRLVAYVVPNGAGASLDGRALSDFVASRLPEYMVPSVIVPLAAFPMTVNQKVDRKALPAPTDDGGARSPEPPRSKLERELAAIIGELLPGTAVGLTDDFYRVLGGSSLAAVRLLDRVEREVGTRIGLAAFTRNPTVAGLAALIENPDAAPGGDDYVVIQEGNATRAPLWLLPAVGGHVLYGEWLRRAMPPYQPLLGIEARGIDGRSEPLDDIESMASAYLPLIRERQPSGPYFLAGPSMGGLVALELARLLRGAGQEVPLLVLLDAWGPNYPSPTSALTRLSDQLQTVLRARGWMDRVALLSARFGQRSARHGGPPRYSVPAGLQGKLAENIRRVAEGGERANARYRPRPYEGHVLLFRATRPTPWSGMRFEDPLNGWGAVIRGKVEVVEIPCGHETLADTPAPEIGRAIQHAVERALGSSADRKSASEPRATLESSRRPQLPDAR